MWRHLPLDRRPPERPARRRGGRGGGRPGRGSGTCTTACSPTRTSCSPRDLRRHAQALGLDVDRFVEDLRTREHAERVADDVRSADASGVTGTPTFFINGQRHQGAYDVPTLSQAVRAARSRAAAVALAATI